uniref:Uncharacterized protein isoform X2 n=1 Tax=Nicotiana tabacum TaxID=4097 RepID=A0A1S3YI90_TOBAC|nr:PREDICTED: uncharacterized protein LOC107776565 isoform X2 [Nicotiana tabacum]
MERLESLEKLRKELARWGDAAFYYQKDNYIKSHNRCFEGFEETFMGICEKIKEQMATNEDIRKTMHGRLYEGVIHDDKGVEVQEVTIKTWDFYCPRQKYYGDHPYRFCALTFVCMVE